MNKDNAHEYLPLVQALANGKTIQYPCGSKSWEDYSEDHDLTFERDARFYRIKPEPRTFEIIKSRLTDAIYSASEWDGTSPNIWERITVQEVL